MGRLDGKVVLISGAARGQGEAEARLFVEEGARVGLGDVRDALGEAVAKDLGDAAFYAYLDVREEADWAHFVATALERWGRVDGLMNNAAILCVRPLLETPLDEYREVIEVNQVGCFLGIKAAAPAMRDSDGGSIVNVSSFAGLSGVPGMASYASSKFAVRGLSRTAARELGPLGIRVNSMHPGGVSTEMMPEEVRTGDDTFLSQPIGRISEPVEQARLALFLISDESSYCTGAEFVADGGLGA
jgi:3alpha(or 20beta)-hydroxysteroid dehydrogenase